MAVQGLRQTRAICPRSSPCPTRVHFKSSSSIYRLRPPSRFGSVPDRNSRRAARVYGILAPRADLGERRMRLIIRHALAGFMIVGLARVATAQKKEFTNWPAGTSPQEVGKKIVTDMLPRWIPTKPSVHYAEDSTWYSALEFAKLTKDQAMTDALVKRFDPWQTEEGQQKLISWQRHVDHSIFGIVPLELYRSEDSRVGKECRSRWSPYHY